MRHLLTFKAALNTVKELFDKMFTKYGANVFPNSSLQNQNYIYPTKCVYDICYSKSEKLELASYLQMKLMLC